MGYRTSCKNFEELSTSIEWIAVNKLGIQAMVLQDEQNFLTFLFWLLHHQY
jgi:hypothetical protein